MAAATRRSGRIGDAMKADEEMPNGGSGSGSAQSKQTTATGSTLPPLRNAPHLPTPLEWAVLALFPAVLVFGTLFSLLSPQTRAAPYDTVAQAHVQEGGLVPSYFACKSNLVNVIFVKRGWAWTTLAFFAFVATHPSFLSGRSSNNNNNNTANGNSDSGGWQLTPRRAKATLRWAVITAWWFVFTQWCAGPPLIDRGFRWTGGVCETARRGGSFHHDEAKARAMREALTATACRAAGGRWRGGHDISGHVFLLVLGTVFLLHEVGWPVLRWSGGWREERCVVMHDGAVKGASVEDQQKGSRPLRAGAHGDGGSGVLGSGGKVALAVAGLNVWMLLMTAIYFHTWFEKLTGLLAALLGCHVVYVLPRSVPALRAVVGLPGI